MNMLFYICSLSLHWILKVSHPLWEQICQSVIAGYWNRPSDTIAHFQNDLVVSGQELGDQNLPVTIQRIHWSPACVLRLNCNFWKELISRIRNLNADTTVWSFLAFPGSQCEGCSVQTDGTDQESKFNVSPSGMRCIMTLVKNPDPVWAWVSPWVSLDFVGQWWGKECRGDRRREGWSQGNLFGEDQ